MTFFKNYWTLLLIILIILGFAFYWHEWRPTRYMKACHLWSLDHTKSIHGDRIDVDYFFKKCLKENGVYKY